MKPTAPNGKTPSSANRRDALKRDFSLAILPTVTILLVLALMEFLAKQHLLFASLASSAFGIYLAPHHRLNGVKVLIGAQLGAAVTGFLAQQLLHPGYFAAAGAMIVVIFAMVALDAVHPPAVATALSFAFVPVVFKSVALFVLAVALVALLVALQKKADAAWMRFD